MALSDIYQLKLEYQMPDLQLGMNVFWYQETGGSGGDAAELSAAFQFGVLDNLIDLFPSNVQFTRVQVLNTNNFADNLEDALTIPGFAGAMVDISQAIAFRKREGGIGTRYSYKRFPLAGGVLVSSNRRVDNTYRDTKAYPVAVALGQQLVGASGVFTPVQVKGGWTMDCTTKNPTYCGEGAVIVHGTLDGQWQTDMKASHQVSRDEHDWETIAAPP